MNARDTAQILMAVIQLGRFANETISLYQSGQLSDKELAKRWDELQSSLTLANARWESTLEGKHPR